MRTITAFFILLGTGSLGHGHPASEPKEAPAKKTVTTEGPRCTLTLVLSDPLDGRPLPGCVRISADGGTHWLDLSPWQARLAGVPREQQSLGWHVTLGKGTLRVPRAKVIIEAFSGIETRLARLELDLRDQETHQVEVPLERLFDASRDHWVAGNTHLHLRGMTREEADRYLVEVARADGLEVVFVSYLERALVDRHYTTNDYTKEDLARISRADLIFGGGEEYRHNFPGGKEGYGHVMLLELLERLVPASHGPDLTGKGTDGVPLQPGLVRARDDGGTVIWCHNAQGHEDVPNCLAGHVDAQNIFDGGNRGGYEDSFYRYLNLGLHLPFSTGTDWFIYDFSRVYVAGEPEVPLTAEAWLMGLREGRSLITNGTWLEFSVNGQGPGARLDLKRGTPLTIAAKGIGRHDFGGLEIISNGRVIHRVETRSKDGVHRVNDLELTLSADVPRWLAVRIAPKEGSANEFGQPLFAHSSPIYVNLEGVGVNDPKVAADLRAEVETSIEAITTQGLFFDEAEKGRVLRVYEEALRVLEQAETGRIQ